MDESALNLSDENLNQLTKYNFNGIVMHRYYCYIVRCLKQLMQIKVEKLVLMN